MNQEDYRLKIFDVMRQPILMIDRNYTIVDVNSAACISMNLTRDKIVGRYCFEAIHKSDRPCWQEEMSCPVQLAFELQKRTRVIHRHTLAGEIVFEEVVASPIFDGEGEINFVVEELRDVRELIHLREIGEHLESEVKTLRGILPICASCKKIRDDKGYWQQVEVYIRDHTHADFSHSYCPECAEKAIREIRVHKDRKNI
jgi:PAS domain S-box-containing protein